MKKLLLLLFVSISFLLQAQTFHEFIMEGDKQYEAKAFEASAMSYEKAFALNEAEAPHYYNAACSWALAGKSDEALRNLKLAANKGWRNIAHIKRDKDLSSLHETEGWTEVLGLLQKNKEEYEKDFNKPVQKQLEGIRVRDQTLRVLLDDAEDRWGRDSEQMSFMWKMINEQDSLCLIECIDIIEKYGWVGQSEVGNAANSSLFLVIQHAPLEVQEKYIPLLEASVKKGESRGSNLALMQDRILMRNEMPQLYGSQITRDKTTDKFIVYEVQDPEYINQRRAAIGMGPIENYVKRWDIEWTVEQKEK